MTNRPTYSPLDSTKQEIRLLRIHPGTYNDDSLQCDLFIADLGDPELQYDALSYCWGSSHRQNTIIVNTQWVQIGESLESALRHLRYPDRKLTIWADAICIDQSNVQERNEQVRLMGLIYSRSHIVHVWLGEGRFEEEMPYELLQWWKEEMAAGMSKATCWRIVERLPSTGSNTLATMVDFYQSQYWQRTWVLQELAFAPDAAIHYGNHQISLHPLLKWKDEIAAIPIASLHLDTKIPNHQALESALEDESLRTFSCMYNMLQILTYLRSDLACTESLIFKIAKALHRNAATDPRDKVFAITGLVPQKSPSLDELIKPDYSKNEMAVWTDFTRYAVKDGSAFGVLQLSGQAFQPSEPSWIPNLIELYSARPRPELLQDDPFVVEAVCPDRTSLWARGKQVDKVDRQLAIPAQLVTELVALEGAQQDDCLGRSPPGSYMRDGAPRLSRLLKMLEQLLSDMNHGQGKVSIRAILGQFFQLLDLVKQHKTLHNLVRDKIQRLVSSGPEFVSIEAHEHDSIICDWRARLIGSILYLTEKDAVGLGSARARPGDHIYALEPDDAMFALRPEVFDDQPLSYSTNAGHCRILSSCESQSPANKGKVSWVEKCLSLEKLQRPYSPTRGLGLLDSWCLFGYGVGLPQNAKGSWIETCLSHEKLRRPYRPWNSIGLLRPWCLFDYGVGLPAKASIFSHQVKPNANIFDRDGSTPTSRYVEARGMTVGKPETSECESPGKGEKSHFIDTAEEV